MEPPKDWEIKTCEKLATTSYCKKRGTEKTPWNDMYCSKTCDNCSWDWHPQAPSWEFGEKGESCYTVCENRGRSCKSWADDHHYPLKKDKLISLMRYHGIKCWGSTSTSASAPFFNLAHGKCWAASK